MNYFNFYYNSWNNQHHDNIFTSENENENFKKFINFLKDNCDFEWADYGLSEKIVFTIPEKLQGKKFFGKKLKEYVVFSPDNQGAWGDFNVNDCVYTADWNEKIENAYHHIEQLIDLEEAEWE